MAKECWETIDQIDGKLCITMENDTYMWARKVFYSLNEVVAFTSQLLEKSKGVWPDG